MGILLLNFLNKNDKMENQLEINENVTVREYSELCYSFLKDNKCIQIPTRALFKVMEVIEDKEISFSFKNVPKSKWTTIHAPFCNCP